MIGLSPLTCTTHAESWCNIFSHYIENNLYLVIYCITRKGAFIFISRNIYIILDACPCLINLIGSRMN